MHHQMWVYNDRHFLYLQQAAGRKAKINRRQVQVGWRARLCSRISSFACWQIVSVKGDFVGSASWDAISSATTVARGGVRGHRGSNRELIVQRLVVFLSKNKLPLTSVGVDHVDNLGR